MKLDIQSVHFKADSDLLEFIQKKVDKLEQFYDGILSGEVKLRIDKAEDKENKVVEIMLDVPGNNLFSKRQCASFEEATDEAVEALRRQVKKLKEKTKP